MKLRTILPMIISYESAMPLRFIYIYIYLLVTGKPDAHHQGRENAKPQELRRWA